MKILKRFEDFNSPIKLQHAYNIIKLLNQHNYKLIYKLLSSLKECWLYADAGYWKQYKYKGCLYLELHTAGWSDNEEIVRMLQNTMFWSFHWRKSVVGGHYYFKINKELLK